MSLHRLLFDATVLNDGANVGAWLRAGSDGDLISSTNEGGKEGIDTYLINPSIEVTATDLDIRDLTHVSDSVKIGDGTDFLLVNGDGSINSVVSATDLDIRDLTAVSDSVQSWLRDGAGTALTSTLVSGKQALDVNIANAGAIDINDELINVALTNAAESIGAASQAAFATPLDNRKWAALYNNGSKDVYIGTGTVTTDNGFPVPAGSILELKIGPAIVLNAISAGGTQNVRSLQGS